MSICLIALVGARALALLDAVRICRRWSDMASGIPLAVV
jgi:hypothetical protein